MFTNLLDDLFVAAKFFWGTAKICSRIYRKLILFAKSSGRYLQIHEGYYKKFVYKTSDIGKFE
jgi:hypothetical protein